MSDVVAFYNSLKPYQKKEERQKSPILHFRNLCGFIKSTIIDKYVKPKDRVLDLCAGRGADIGRLMKRNISEYVAIDISDLSIEELKRRFKLRYKFFKKCYFFVCDVFGSYFLENEYFDIINCQFAFHYAFENEDKLNFAMFNVSSHLREGGHFIITVPDENIIRKRMGSGNDVYSLDYKGGNRYHFWLIESIDIDEFIVDKKLLLFYAGKYNLKLVESNSFRNVYYPKYEDLSLNERELVDLYEYMVFVKALK